MVSSMSSLEITGQAPAIVAIVGASESGKTTLIEALIANLKSRGYRVATIKHVPRELSFDRPYKDSWRHIRAGSEATLIVSAGQAVLVKPTLSELSLNEAARLLGSEYDILLAEGFKQSDAPKIKVCKGSEDGSAVQLKNVIAIVSGRQIESGVRSFSPNQVDRIADFLEEMFLKSRRG